MNTLSVVALLVSGAALVVALLLSRAERVPRRPPYALAVSQLQRRNAALQEELAAERMRVVACGAVASGVRLSGVDEVHEYWSPSYEDVARLAARTARQGELLRAIGEGSCVCPFARAARVALEVK